jgi:hypothetical protein
MKRVNRPKVIYLDQNFVSSISKVKLGQIKDERFTTLYELLKGLLDEKRIIVPESVFHSIESEWASETVKLKILEIINNLSQGVGFKDWREILDLQVSQSIRVYFTKVAHETPPPSSVGEVLLKGPINRSLSHVIQEMREAKELYARRWEAYRLEPERKIFRRQKELEANSIIRHYFSLPWEIPCLSTYIMTAYSGEVGRGRLLYKEFDPKLERFDYFLDSRELRSVPFIDIVSSINAAVTVYEGARRTRESDFYDVQIVGTILPYCDVLATDNFMRSILVTRLALDKKYHTEVFSEKGREINRFLEYLLHLNSQES